VTGKHGGDQTPRVLITGANRGIGRATALLLAERRAELLLVGRDSDDLRRGREACRTAGAADATIYPADLREPRQIEDAVRSILGAGPAPDAVIHNAGVARRAAMEEMSLEDWREQIGVNLDAPFLVTKRLLPAMRARGRGRIVFVGSISSTLGTARQSAYCASKWAIVGLMKSLAEELSDSGLMTAALLPGSVATAMLEGSGFPPRMTPEDVAKTLVFLALDAPTGHNGAVIEMFGT
jgi:3-oxoacyl-[acyl-carrier protein] reductase